MYRNGTRFGSQRLEVNKSGFYGNDPSLKVFQRNLNAGQLQCTKKDNASYMSARGQRLFKFFDKLNKNKNAKDTALLLTKRLEAARFF